MLSWIAQALCCAERSSQCSLCVQCKYSPPDIVVFVRCFEALGGPGATLAGHFLQESARPLTAAWSSRCHNGAAK